VTLQPLMNASWAVQVHVATLIAALLVGTWLCALTRRGSPVHRTLGRIFLLLMVLTAAMAALIRVRPPHSSYLGLSWFHLFVPLVLGLCGLAIYGATTHRVRVHRFAAINLYFGSLVFTAIVQVFLARGITHQVFFSR
jgi:uncharacterized membrane protein